MTKIQYRSLAKQHLESAKRLLASEDSSDARYACLELRLAIEAIVYDTLQAYVRHYGQDLMESWQPQKILKELVKIDPYAATSSSLSVRPDGAPASEYKSLGQERRFSLQWADKTYNTLGSFLHMPTIAQQDQKRNVDMHTMRRRAEDAADEIDKALSAKVFNLVFTNTYHLDCACGFKIAHKAHLSAAEFTVECPSCGNLYDVCGTKESRFVYTESLVQATCPACGDKSETNAKLKEKPGTQFTCSKCGVRSQSVVRIGLVQLP